MFIYCYFGLEVTGETKMKTKTLALLASLVPQTALAGDYFAGTILSEDSRDSIAQVNHERAYLGIEELNAENFALGLRSPQFGKFRLSSANDFTLDTLATTTFLEAFPTDDLTLRSGVLANSDSVGGFAGGKFSTDKLTLDLDLSYQDTFAARGFVGAQLGDFYTSVGGNSEGRTLSTVNGWINPGAFGVYSQAIADLDDRAGSWKLILADKATYQKGNFDFKSHVFSGTEMRSGFSILDGWAPFDAFASERLSLVAKGSHAEDSHALSATVYLRNQTGFAGLGGTLDGNLKFELYQTVPKTPFEAWADLTYDPVDKTTQTTFYVGALGEW
jgi:hypothetical protein